jgi:hypothetical protein
MQVPRDLFLIKLKTYRHYFGCQMNEFIALCRNRNKAKCS